MFEPIMLMPIGILACVGMYSIIRVAPEINKKVPLPAEARPFVLAAVTVLSPFLGVAVIYWFITSIPWRIEHWWKLRKMRKLMDEATAIMSAFHRQHISKQELEELRDKGNAIHQQLCEETDDESEG